MSESGSRSRQAAPERYPASLLRLHWMLAVLLPAMVVLGLYMGGLPRGDPLKSLLMNWHLATGVLVFTLALARLWLRLSLRTPPLPDAYRPAERFLARGVHGAFYALMLGLPLIGFTVWLVDPFVGPAVAGEGVAVSNWAGRLHRLHYLGAWLLVALVPVHVAGALRRTDGQRTLSRMLPARKPSAPELESKPKRKRGRTRRRR